MRHVKVRHGDKYLVSEPPKGRLRRENGYISKKLSQNTNLNRKGHGKRLDIVLLDEFSTAALANSPVSILPLHTSWVRSQNGSSGLHSRPGQNRVPSGFSWEESPGFPFQFVGACTLELITPSQLPALETKPSQSLPFLLLWPPSPTALATRCSV